MTQPSGRPSSRIGLPAAQCSLLIIIDDTVTSPSRRSSSVTTSARVASSSISLVTISAESMATSQRLAGALIGIAGAIGAFGGVLVDLAFRQSFIATKTADAAYIAFIAFYAICVAVTWYVYLRPSPSRLEGV